ncbi:MAG: TonB-dependent receptor plug domain-containing protein, partial [Pseudomonadales bacterium]|nr:TonB-dependent receptor plug domain-containing protein [Pseudomonadales bacterium]
MSCIGANAQEVEEVVIQGTQTENSALDDLVSVSAIDAEKLADAGIENIEDVAEYVPNLVLSETSTGTAIVIRGIGAGVNQGFDQSVGLYVDGVPLPRSQMARAPFLDLGGVQVLRGPQYVKDGNYSIAGSVHMLTKEADDEFQLGIDVNYVPSQNDKKLLITLGTPLADWGAMRLAVQR